MSGQAAQSPFTIEGYGTFTLPKGMTQEEADRLAREADAKNKENN